MTDSRAGLLSALPDFGFASVFLITWLSPYAFGRFMVKWLLLVMLLEFIIIHSAAFMGIVAFRSGSRASRVARIFGIALFYSVFAGAFSFAFKSVWPITAFWGQTLNRMLGVILGQGRSLGQKVVVMAGWGASTAFYLIACVVTSALPVPRLGITADVVAAQEIPGGGLWVEHPEKVIAFGVVYFGLTAWSELNAHSWAGKVRSFGDRFAVLTRPRSP